MSETSTQLQAAAGVLLIAVGVVTAPYGGGFLIALGGSLVVGAAAQELAPKPKLGGGGPDAKTSISGTVPPEMVFYGRCVHAGTPIWLGETNVRRKDISDLEFMHVPYILTRRRRVDALEGIWILGSYYPVERNEGDVDYFANSDWIPRDSKYKSHIAIHFEPGDGSEGLWIIDGQDDWNEDCKLTSIAYCGVTFRAHESLWQNGAIASLKFQLRGFRLFDPVTGLTQWSANAALCWRDFMTQIHGPGGGINSALIDSTAAIAARNICAEVVTRSDGDQIPRYECHGAWMATEDWEPVERAILATMGGSRHKLGASWFVHAAGARSVVMDLSPDDWCGPMQIQPKRPRDQLINECKALFVNRGKGYQDDETPPFAPAAYLIADNLRQMVSELELRGVTHTEQAQRLVKQHVEQNRRQISLSVTAKPTRAMLLRPMDVVRITDKDLGWGQGADGTPGPVVTVKNAAGATVVVTNASGDPVTVTGPTTGKKFLIVAYQHTEAGVRMDLVEYDDAVYSWRADEEQAEAGSGDIKIGDYSETVPVLLDMPTFRLRDTTPEDFGFLAGVRTIDPGKRMAPFVRLLRSDAVDGEYQQAAIFTRPLIAGTCKTILGTAPSVHLTDEASTVDVLLDQDVELASATDYELMNGLNMAYIGFQGTDGLGEIVQFGGVTVLSPRTVRLSRFRRGLHGTEDQTKHRAGELFILLTPELLRIPAVAAERKLDRYYKLSDLTLVSDDEPVKFRNNARGKRPLPPLRAQLTRDRVGNLRISWASRERGLYGWVGTAPRPDGDSHRFYIKRKDGTEREVVVFGRDYYDYKDLEQRSDFGGPVSSLTVRISRRGDKVGYGSGDYTTFNLSVTGTH